jgi:hypothetical protein
VRKSKARARLRASRARFLIEQLETRVLLFSGPVGAPFLVFPLGVQPPQASVSLVTPAAASVAIFHGDGSSALPSTGEGGQALGEDGQAQIAAFHPALFASSIQAGSPTLFPIDRNALGGYPAVGPNAEGWWPEPTQGSDVSILNVTTQEAGAPSAEPMGDSEIVVVHIDRPILFQNGADPYGPETAGNGSTLTSPVGVDDGTSGVTLPPGSRGLLAGMYDQGRPFLPYQLAGDTGPDGFGFPAHGPGDPGMSPYMAMLSADSADSADSANSDGMPSVQGGGGLTAAAIPFQSFSAALRFVTPAIHLLGKISSSTNSSSNESGLGR